MRVATGLQRACPGDCGEGVIFGDRSEIEIVRVRCDCGRGGNNWGVGVDVLLGPSKL